MQTSLFLRIFWKLPSSLMSITCCKLTGRWCFFTFLTQISPNLLKLFENRIFESVYNVQILVCRHKEYYTLLSRTKYQHWKHVKMCFYNILSIAYISSKAVYPFIVGMTSLLSLQGSILLSRSANVEHLKF